MKEKKDKTGKSTLHNLVLKEDSFYITKMKVIKLMKNKLNLI